MASIFNAASSTFSTVVATARAVEELALAGQAYAGIIRIQAEASLAYAESVADSTAKIEAMLQLVEVQKALEELSEDEIKWANEVVVKSTKRK